MTSDAAEPLVVFNVWPNGAPTEIKVPGEEQVLANRPRPFYQLTNITTPTVSVFLPSADKRNGTAVLVCPGGGLQRLAIEHEGFEVAQWLTEQGFTAFVLKYRVPAPANIGLQDAQRAISLIRSRADEWQVDAGCIGCIGFSAGAEICAWLATHADDRQYAAIDQHDETSCRPTFAALIYAGGLVNRSGEVKPAIASKLHENSPPFFIAHAFADDSLNSLAMAVALRKANTSTELHVYQNGVHGFGARKSGQTLDNWRAAFLNWSEANGYLDAAWVRDYEKSLYQALQTGASLPQVSSMQQQPSLKDCFAIQRRAVQRQMQNDRVVGFKGGAVYKSNQAELGIKHPLIGVLFASGKLDSKEARRIAIDTDAETILETEVGFVVGVDIAYEIPTVEHAKSAVEYLVPVIEMPKRYTQRLGQEPTLAETIALNVSASRFLMGAPIKPSDFHPEQLSIAVQRDGRPIGNVDAASIELDLWEDLHALLNQAVERGYTIPAGSVILSGALGQVYVAQPSTYQADFGQLGTVQFEMTSGL